MSLPAPFRGIITPIVTPLSGPDQLDTRGFDRLIEHVIAGGVRGIFALGTTGEAPSLSYRLKREVVARVCRTAAGRVPVLAGISDTSFADSIDLAEHAAREGAAALVLAPPYYFTTGQPELLEYLEHIVPRLPLPVFLYNIPSLTKNSFEPALVGRAAHIDGIAGIKDSSGDLEYLRTVSEHVQHKPEFSVMIGPEELLAEAVRVARIHGGVCGGSNLHPSLYVALLDAAQRGDATEVERLHAIVMQISNGIYRVGRHSSSYLKGLKCALSLKGICDDFMAEPFHRFREPERRRVRECLERIGLL